MEHEALRKQRLAWHVQKERELRSGCLAHFASFVFVNLSGFIVANTIVVIYSEFHAVISRSIYPLSPVSIEFLKIVDGMVRGRLPRTLRQRMVPDPSLLVLGARDVVVLHLSSPSLSHKSWCAGRPIRNSPTQPPQGSFCATTAGSTSRTGYPRQNPAPHPHPLARRTE